MASDWPGEPPHHEHMLARFVKTGTKLVLVMGPRNATDDASHWLGALLSVVGNSDDIPTIAEAIEDGLFAPGSGRYLVPFDPGRARPGQLEEARTRTREARRMMRARAHAKQLRESAVEQPVLPDAPVAGSGDAAVAYARNTRLKFERVYESARKALAAGDTATALLKCQAARDLLLSENLYGSAQEQILTALEHRIRQMELG
ncbi:MAG: hypothetical protein JXR94_01935 [Candidatus Hydrogenedentes bacterium]|nr:hypothetical protein [Candidatus Hydrogenedentota bacterium]